MYTDDFTLLPLDLIEFSTELGAEVVLLIRGVPVVFPVDGFRKGNSAAIPVYS